MNMLAFSIKNLARYKRRTLITSAALAFGILGYIAVDSIVAGANEETERNFVLYETGDSVIVHSEYWEEHELRTLNDTVADGLRVVGDLQVQGVASTARVHTTGEVVVYRDPFPEDGSLYASIYGVDLATQAQVFDYHSVVAAGRWLDDGAKNEVVLGGWLAEDIGAEVGFPITVVTQTKKGFRQTIDATVVGILNCPNPVINRSAVIFPLQVLDTFLQLDGSVTEVVFPVLNEAEHELVEEFVRRDSSLVRIPFTILAADFFALAESESAGNTIFLLIIFIIAAVGVSNTMLMAVLERSKEIGMLQSIGMSPSRIYAMFLYESAGIGVIGGVIGVVCGALLNIWLVEHGIDYGALLRDYDFGYRITSVFRGAWRVGTFASALGIAVFVTVLTAYMPVRRILKRRSITDNLRAH